jgi:hypothetical protein
VILIGNKIEIFYCGFLMSYKCVKSKSGQFFYYKDGKRIAKSKIPTKNLQKIMCDIKQSNKNISNKDKIINTLISLYDDSNNVIIDAMIVDDECYYEALSCKLAKIDNKILINLIISEIPDGTRKNYMKEKLESTDINGIVSTLLTLQWSSTIHRPKLDFIDNLLNGNDKKKILKNILKKMSIKELEELKDEAEED